MTLSRISNWEELAREARFEPSNMAALCPTSLRHLERFFTIQFNKTPSEWARELKCRLARQLIAEGWSNKAVAAELHFGNESHLCHEFKRFFGASPQTFGPGWPPAHIFPRASAAQQPTRLQRRQSRIRDLRNKEEFQRTNNAPTLLPAFPGSF